MDLSPLDYMLKEYPEVKERDEMRKIIGRYGITGKQQTTPIGNLSDGQRVRLENFNLENHTSSYKSEFICFYF